MIKHKRPDILVVLVLLLGVGVIMTELSYGSVFSGKKTTNAPLAQIDK
jgi:hypothetical protein